MAHSDATLVGNTVASNAADVFGGGFDLLFSAATLSGNTIISNTAGDSGGGLSLDDESNAAFERNVIAQRGAVVREYGQSCSRGRRHRHE
jgi:hypothetical protein